DRTLVNPATGLALVKPKVTLGFPITLAPGKRFKNAVAVVAVEGDVDEKADLSAELDAAGAPKMDANGERVSFDRPSITALLPREKTYNVAAIKDSSVSIGGGVATQLLGFSASWLHGRKEYYLVRDQDTVALSYRPASARRVAFEWQFRPVLGEEFVKAGLKETFVQLALPAKLESNPLVHVHVQTYWRAYDKGRGL